MDIKNSVQRQFGEVAAQYASSAVHRGGPDLQAMVEAAGLTGAERVLDLGCGAGHTALALAPEAASVLAVDLTEEMLAQGRRLAEERGQTNIEFRRGDVERLEVPDGSFDLVTSRYSAHHLPHPRAALAEVARVLRPGGRFLLVDVVSPPGAAQDSFLNAIEVLRDPSHVRDHRVREWLAMIGEAGLDPDLLGEWPLRLQFAGWLARMRTPAVAASAIEYLLDGAPQETREILAVELDRSFSVPVALIRGVVSVSR